MPARSVRSEMRAIKAVWRRELIRFSRDRLRIVTSLVQPFLFLFVLGTGLSTLVSTNHPRGELPHLHLPGHPLHGGDVHRDVLGRLDRVGPRVRVPARDDGGAGGRSSIVLGKCVGGATVAAFQGVIVMAIGPLVGVHYTLGLALEVFALQVLLAFSITAFGMMAAARVTQMQSFMALMQMAIMPMFFLSGALFPVNNLPTWLAVLNRLDPLTYAVDPMRRAVFAHLDISPAVRNALAPGVTWFGWRVPGLLEAAMVAIIGLAMLAIAIAEFSSVE